MGLLPLVASGSVIQVMGNDLLPFSVEHMLPMEKECWPSSPSWPSSPVK